jgi:hypothetical protein
MKVGGIVSCKKSVHIWFMSGSQNGIHSGLGDYC